VADAKPLIENMGGPVAPADWQGGLPIQYHLGGEQARVHLKIRDGQPIKPYFVVEGRIQGSDVPDQWIVLGNHRDAWVFGGVDPSSGTASMMEMTRAFGALLKQGVRPRRTLVFCSWDGEEVGLTGSTEWGEQFGEELQKKAVAYINVDSSVSGPDFDGSAVGSLTPMLIETTHSLEDPSGVSLYEAWKNARAKKNKESGDVPVRQISSLPIRVSAVDQDHTVCLNYVGIPVIGLSFDGPYGVYHSAYDNFYWMNHFGDPGYRYHTLASNLWGVLALRLANADLLPFDFDSYAQNVRAFVKDLGKGRDVSQVDLKSLLLKLAEFEAAGRKLNAAISTVLASKSTKAASKSISRCCRLNETG
jgi:N-acetylated-alpha-linked acidic dipeptidase